MALTNAELRTLLTKILRTDADFDAFCIDYFEEIHRQFSSGMSRIQKENLLIILADRLDLEKLLKNNPPRSVAVTPLSNTGSHSDIESRIRAPVSSLATGTELGSIDKYTVFICATPECMAVHRKTVITAINTLANWHPVSAIESESDTQECSINHKKQVENSSVIVVLYGNQYEPENQQIYIALGHNQFRIAVNRGKPLLAFIEQFPQDGYPFMSYAQPELETYRRDLMRSHVLDFFESPVDLAQRVTSALENWESQSQRMRGLTPGHIRPLSPQPFVAHPYPLDRHFVGREAERSALMNWLNHGAAHLLVLEAIGGLGKTTLAWCFSQFDVLGAPLAGAGTPPLNRRIGVPIAIEGLIWWSFYELNARFPEFLTEALRYGGSSHSSDGSSNLASTGDKSRPVSGDKVRQLLHLLETRRFLIVLDGFERELKSYWSGYHPDHGDDPPGGDLKDARRCIDPDASRFLIGLCGLPHLRSKVLLTSRLLPAELEGVDGAPFPACQRFLLRDFSDQEVYELFQHSKIEARPADIQQITGVYGCHPLAVRLLIGVICNDPQYPGELRAAAEYDVVPHLYRRAHHILQVAFDSLSPANQRMLSAIAAFRGPVDFRAVEAAEISQSKIEKITPRSGQELRGAVRELVSRNLLLREERRGFFDLHPVVRKYSYQRLVNRKTTHHDLGNYFESFASSIKIGSRRDLSPLLELYFHMIAVGDTEKALELLYQRIYAPLVQRFHDLRTATELFSALTPDGMPHRHTQSVGNLGWWFNEQFAQMLRSSGFIRRALDWMQKTREHVTDDAGLFSVAELGVRESVEIANETALLRNLGKLTEAYDRCRRRIELPWTREFGLHGLLCAEHTLTLACIGETLAALQLLEQIKLDHLPARLDNINRSISARTHRLAAQTLLLCGDIRGAKESAQRGIVLCKEAGGDALELVEVEIALACQLAICAVVGLQSAMQSSDVAGTAQLLRSLATSLDENLRRSREIGLGECEIDISIALASVKLHLHDLDDSRSLATLAESFAARGEQRLRCVDARLILAEVELSNKSPFEASKWAISALALAKGDREDERYVPGVSMAERCLARIASCTKR